MDLPINSTVCMAAPITCPDGNEYFIFLDLHQFLYYLKKYYWNAGVND